jgi:23S rRNA pseudouridine1911/1915/1917 synthase
MTEPLDVLYEDPHLVAVAKVVDRLSQGVSSGDSTMEDDVRRWVGVSSYLGTVHRLDRPVSGVLLWAKSEKAARRLSSQFAARRVAKEYWAVVEFARQPPRAGLWEDWLTASVNAAGMIQRVDPATARAKQALTHIEVGRGGDVPDGMLWLRLHPQTGRTHQLRVQVAARGMPVWGDGIYGSTRAFTGGIALHARSLTFEHPVSRRSITIQADPPRAWQEQGIVLPTCDGLLNRS